MNGEITARTSGKYRRINTIFVAVSTAVMIVGIIGIIYSIAHSSWLFAASYFIGLILLFTYVMIRVNTVYTTYLMYDDDCVVMKNWTNDFLPYDVGNKFKVLSEFIPARTKITEIPVEEIDKVLIGTKNFIKRNVDGDDLFLERIAPYEKTKDYYQKRTVSGMDIFYVHTIDNESYYMPIMNFNTKAVKKILTNTLLANPEIDFRSSSRTYRTIRPGMPRYDKYDKTEE